MNWLKDRKNLPIAVGLLSATLVGTIAMVFSQMGHTGGEIGQETASAAVTPVIIPETAPSTVKAASPSKPVLNLAKTPDPFYYQVASVSTPRLSRPIVPIINDWKLPSPEPTQKTPIQLPHISSDVQDTTPRRVSGTLFSSNSVYAILETNGASQAVQPGDLVDGGRVVSIQSNGLTLLTQDNHTLSIPLSAVQTGIAMPLDAIPNL